MARQKPLSPETPPLSPLQPKSAPIPGVWKGILIALFAGYLGLGAVHIQNTPVAPNTATNYINAPDEAAHLVYVRAVAEKGHIPIQNDPRYPTYEWHQPPLFYSLVSVAHPGGAIAVRCATLLLGALGVWLVFLTVRRIFPHDPAAAVTAAGFTALLPMRQATTSSVGNDVMIELLFTATMLVIARAFHSGFTLGRAITLGAAIGMGLATKANGILLIPIFLAALVFFRGEGETYKAIGRGAAWTLIVALILPAGWWARNYRLYGEITPIRAFMREFEHTKKADEFIGRSGFTADVWSGEMRPAENITRGQYTSLLANWTYRTFWASYTPPGRAAELGIPFFLPPVFYVLGGLLLLPSLGGLWKLHARRKYLLATPQVQMIRLSLVMLLLVGASFMGFTWTYFQAQGRYLYPAMLPISMLWAVGLRAMLPEKYRDSGSVAALTVLLLMSLLFLFAGILPAYAPQG